MASPSLPEEMDETVKQNLLKVMRAILPEFIGSVQPTFEEMLKHSETSHSLPEIQRDVHENSNVQLEEKKEISNLSARLKKAEDELRKKDEFLYKTVKDISEVTNKSLDITERLGTKFQIYMVKDDRLKEIQMLRQQCKALEKSLATEVKSHNRLLMKLNKINTSALKSQAEYKEAIRSLQESTKNTSSKLTDLLTLAEESKRSNVNGSHLPAHILGFAFRIEKEFDDKDKIKQFGLALGLNSYTVEKIVNENTGKVFWDVLYEWNKTSQSVVVLISACQTVSISSFSDGLMPADHSTAIEKAYSRLAADIFVDHVVIYLRDNAVLSGSDVEYILSPETKKDKLQRLVDILPLFGEKAFDSFVEALTKSGQNHLADILKDELKKLTSVSDTLNGEELEQTLQSEMQTNDDFHSLNESDEADFVINNLTFFIIILLCHIAAIYPL